MSNSEKVKGNVKEAAGKLVGNEDLEREGEAQQERGEHLDKADDARDDAEDHDDEARKAKNEQRSHQS